jgi:hypothetical protein
METCGMYWNESNEDKIFNLTFIEHYKDFHFWGDILNTTYFDGGSLNIYLHNNTFQHLFGSNLIFSTFKQNILEIL